MKTNNSGFSEPPTDPATVIAPHMRTSLKVRDQRHKDKHDTTRLDVTVTPVHRVQ